MTQTLLLKTLTPLVKFIPIKALDIFGQKIADLGCHLLKRKRAVVEQNLYYLLGPNVDKKTIRINVRKTFRNFARCFVDFLRIPFLDHQEIVNMVEPHGISKAHSALKIGKGLILITLHLGNWDFAGCYLGILKLPIIGAAEETESAMFKFYTQRREYTGIKTISVKSSPFTFARILKENKILVLAGDRDITHTGIRMKFFNGWRMVPVGPERLAKALNAPVAVGYMVLNKNKKYRYLGVIEDIEIVKKETSFLENLVKKFERIVRQYPDQWFVFQPEWVN